MMPERIEEIRQYLEDTQPKSNDDYSTQDVATLRAHCKRLLKAIDNNYAWNNFKRAVTERQDAIERAEAAEAKVAALERAIKQFVPCQACTKLTGCRPPFMSKCLSTGCGFMFDYDRFWQVTGKLENGGDA